MPSCENTGKVPWETEEVAFGDGDSLESRLCVGEQETQVLWVDFSVLQEGW